MNEESKLNQELPQSQQPEQSQQSQQLPQLPQLPDEVMSELTEAAQSLDKALKLGVNRMILHTWKSLDPDRNGDHMIQAVFDTLTLKADGTPRYMTHNFHLTGTFKGGDKKNAQLAKFLLDAFGITQVTNETLAQTVGKKLAVATYKDTAGYLNFWYGRKIEEFQQTVDNYKRRDESNGVRPGSSDAAQRAHETAVNFNNVLQEATAGGKTEEGDDLPF